METQHTVRPAARMANVRYAIRDILVEAEKVRATGMPLTLLNIGDPAAVGGFHAPDHLIEAVRKAWADHRYEYAPSCGIAEAREAVAADYARRGMKVAPRHVILTTGLSEAIRFLLTALVDPGDEVLVPAPGYPLYQTILGELGGVARPYCLDEARGWRLDEEALERAVCPRTRAAVLVSPSNPTGHVFDPEELRQMVAFCRRHGLLLICDEVYDRLAYDVDGPVPSAAQLCGDDLPVVTLNGLSKNWLLPGARVGWMAFH
ncbi:MAG TPA: pyridoxal phosphate-dependent aminotransferase, partial [Myxococcota bacterium]|nr:pyridoxal phosphate-dependent aminotransferase [Myxococcota bacterium]